MIRILIAEPMTLTREGLVALIERENDIELAAAVRHREEVVRTARAVRPDVALLAAAFPDRDGIAVAAGLHAAVPDCRETPAGQKTPARRERLCRIRVAEPYVLIFRRFCVKLPVCGCQNWQ